MSKNEKNWKKNFRLILSSQITFFYKYWMVSKTIKFWNVSKSFSSIEKKIYKNIYRKKKFNQYGKKINFCSWFLDFNIKKQNQKKNC